MTTLIDRIGKTYDEVPYTSAAFHVSAPEHLRAVAHLFGLEAPALEGARVLELGCAAGGNLVPFAVRHPGADVVGIDLSPRQIEAGRRAVEAMGLQNVRLIQGSLTDLGADLGQFDYILCHGVYSWVPEDVRAAVLRVCNERLTADGIAYVSYNTYPGWKAKEIVRDAMLLRGGDRADAGEQLAYARGMVEFLHEQAAPGSVLSTVMNEHIGLIRDGEDFYLSHEYLELCNAPCYFRDFIAAARGQGLEYLGDATVASMFPRNYGPIAAPALVAECGGDQVMLEQLMDFLQNRAFRQSLLVRADRGPQIRYQLEPDRIASLHVAGRYAHTDTQDDGSERWASMGGAHITTRSPITRAVLERLTAAWPATVPVAELLDGIAMDDAAIVLDLVSNLIVGNALRFRSEAVASGAQVERPFARGELRALVGLGAHPMALFNEWHESAALTPLERFLLASMDGRKDVQALVADVLQAVEQGALTVMRDGAPLLDADELAASLRMQVDAALRSLQINAMLVGAPEASPDASASTDEGAENKPARAKPKPKGSKADAPKAASAKPAKTPRGKK
ncbi:class I SAM-dependent methyltransferase [Lysobacter auxotrophicus]|uniref:Methyltransferase regulatory domain-containing protein n=1 Tax=Lysobacter auxotrophicus TaxID=2992573 RepID=A0ABN6UHP3_9GAMM|nr:class I SAM-dependent methyltransferase [Lysobacter auxotrophicus]BDU15833.1 methyltransferase regulatory domain-containing protein [Lysobacter auxotrophicus]